MDVLCPFRPAECQLVFCLRRQGGCDSSGNDSDPQLLKSVVKISQPENPHMENSSLPDRVRYMKNDSMMICYENALSLILTKIIYTCHLELLYFKIRIFSCCLCSHPDGGRAG